MKSIDRRRLLDWLKERAATHQSALVAAVYMGLITRIAAGQFDREGPS